MDFYIIYQVDTKDSYKLSLISFCEKDTYIYGIYFDVVAQARFSRRLLKSSSCPIELSDIARFITAQYLELYNDVLGTPIILGLLAEINNIDQSDGATPTGSIFDRFGASLQYSHCHKYYYTFMNGNGITNPHIPTTRLLGLSRNLQRHH